MWDLDASGRYEFEYVDAGPNATYRHTGWYRCVNGRLANGLWPEWHSQTGETRYS
jgi:hypothetical protein